MKPTVFIATPIAGFADEKDYLSFKNKLKTMSRRISKKITIHAEILKVHSFLSYDSPNKAAAEDFGNIEHSTFFVIIYPFKIPTSALIELGFAIALKKKILILTTKQDVLPYMIKEIDKVYSNVQISYFSEDWTGVEDIIQNFILQ